MPVENIHRDGSLMFNKTPKGGVLADCVSSVTGQIHEDDEFNEDDLKLIKDKDDSMKPYWRYLTDSQASAKRKDREELEALDAEVAEMHGGPSNQPGAFLDSTGEEGDVTIEEKMEESKTATTKSAPKSKTAPNVAANNKDN